MKLPSRKPEHHLNGKAFTSNDIKWNPWNPAIIEDWVNNKWMLNSKYLLMMMMTMVKLKSISVTLAVDNLYSVFHYIF